MKIDPKLRVVYDLSHNIPQFTNCGKAFDGKEHNVLCFTEGFAKTIDWKLMEKTYKANKEQVDNYIKENEKAIND
jgi:hypothetical protein